MPKGKAYNKGGGKEAMEENSMREKATEPKGKMKQSKGSKDMKAKVSYSKKEKNLENGMTMF